MRAATLIALALALIVPAAGLSSPSSASTWRVVKSKSVSGQFAATGISATIKHPRGIAVRFVGNGVHGFAAWGCSRGLSVASWSRSYGAACTRWATSWARIPATSPLASAAKAGSRSRS